MSITKNIWLFLEPDGFDSATLAIMLQGLIIHDLRRSSRTWERFSINL